MPKLKTTKNLSKDQIRGQIATMQSDLGKLEREHVEDQKTFNERMSNRLKRHNELTGGIAALTALLG